MPDRHRVIDNQFPADLVRRAADEWPVPSWPHWVCYDSPLERKRACNDWRVIPPACAELLRRMLLLEAQYLLCPWSWPPERLADSGLYGAGLHDMGHGHHLDMHLDADRHPLTGLERRANAILFLEPWRPEWGGEFWLWPDMAGQPVTVAPAAGRLLLFETSDTSYHGVPDPIRCPLGVRRKSLAVYWWGIPRGASKRPRALFAPRPGEPDDPAKAVLRAERVRPRDCHGTVTAAAAGAR